MIDAQFDQSGHHVEGSWPLEEHPGIAEAVATLRPVSSRLDPERVGPVVRDILAATGVTHGVWVPVCPDGELHGVLVGRQPRHPGARGVRRPGRRPRVTSSSWPCPTGRPTRNSSTGRRPRSAAGSLVSCTTGSRTSSPSSRARRVGGTGNRPKTLDVRELSGAADRALDEARRAITVLSVPQPQSLGDAIAQTAEDLGLRLGVAIDLDLADDADVPGEVTENLLRIVREAVTNAAMHGQASHVTVRLDQTRRRATGHRGRRARVRSRRRARARAVSGCSACRSELRRSAPPSVCSQPRSDGTIVEVAFQ